MMTSPPTFSGSIVRDPSIAKVRQDSGMKSDRLLADLKTIHEAMEKVAPEIHALPEGVTLRYTSAKSAYAYDSNTEGVSLEATTPDGEVLKLSLYSFPYSNANAFATNEGIMPGSEFASKVHKMLAEALKVTKGLVWFYQIKETPAQKEL